MSEHRRKQPQSGHGGRASRRGLSGAPTGRRAAPRGGATPPPADPSSRPEVPEARSGHGSSGAERPWGGRAEARRAAQRGGRGRRRAADGAGRGGRGGGRRGTGGPGGTGPGRGRGRGPAPKKRFIDYPRAGKYGWRRWVPSWRLVTGTFLTFVGGLMLTAGILYKIVDVPKVAEAATAQNNVYYWSDGTQMVATGGERNRRIINYEDIPRSMRWAVISAENKTFWTDRGIDPMGIARAVKNMIAGGETQGGSTITQQYVKNARLGDQSQTLTRKVKELFISIKVGAKVPKEEILAGYLNTAYYGRGAYGIQAAAHAYFDKDAEKLNPSQCAFLAAVLKGATYYDPAGATSIDPAASPEANRKRAVARWKWILDEEVAEGYMSRAERAKYRTFPKLQNPRSNSQLGGQIGYLVDLAKGNIIKNTDITERMLQRGGYDIYTTFDKKKVKEMEKAVSAVRKANIKPKLRPETDTHVQFGGASVEPSTGAIRAVYGGEDATKHFTNNADETGAQVGSTFKPFVLAAAMRDGVRDKHGPAEQGPDQRTIVSPKSMYVGKNKLKIKNYDGSIWTDKEGKEWLQTNDGGEDYGKAPNYLVTLREAMQWSVNSPFVQLGMDVGLDKVKQAAIDTGVLESSLASSAYPSFSIGTSSPSAIRMAGAYSTFAANGEQRDPYSVEKVEYGGDTVYRHKDTVEQKFTPEVAHNITDVLKNVVDKGTGTAARLYNRQVAGKTGTTDGNKSAWFVGYTPQLSTAISMFRLDDDENNKHRQFLEMFGTGGQKKIHGASFPASIWHDYMAQALRGTPPKPFPPAEPIGERVGATPSPTTSPSPSTDPTVSDSPTPSMSPTDSGSPSDPVETCSPWVPCHGGNANGGTDVGNSSTGTVNGGTDGGGTTGEANGGNEQGGTTRGNDHGGFFGGPSG